MNILFLTHQGGIAGSTQSIFYLAKGLAKRGHKVYVGCKKESLLYKLLQPSPAIAVPMPFKHKADWKTMRQITQLVRSEHIEIINAQSGIDRYITILGKILFRFNALVIHTRRQTGKQNYSLTTWLQSRFTAKIVAVSRGVKQKLIELGLPSDHIVVIHNGTPAEKYQLKNPNHTEDLRKIHHLSHNDIVIGCVSRYKQQEQLLLALEHITRPMTLILVGVDEREQYKLIRKRISPPHRIIYTGRLKPEEILYYYPLFDVKVLPSVTEGLSQSLLESMAMGVPVIATRAAGNADLIDHEKNGLLFESKDTRELADYILRFLDDPNLRKKCITNAKKTALQDFSIERTIDRYEQFFRELIQRNGVSHYDGA
ncbi:MAG: glycosyltransferase [Caldithrix sp.]|nr:glycosyltransferase [Caldithrix sp.]